MKHTKACDKQDDVEDGENKSDLEDYFPKDKFDESNTSNDDLSSEEDDDEELERVRKEKKSRKEKLTRDFVCANAQIEGVVQGDGTSNAIRVVSDENYPNFDNVESPSNESESKSDGEK